jgi:transposase-like protein
MLGEELRPGFEAEAKERMRAGGGDKVSDRARAGGTNSSHPLQEPDLVEQPAGRTNTKIAQAVGVGEGTVKVAHKVKKEAPELADKVISGEMTLHAAERHLKPKKPRKENATDAKKLAAAQAVLDEGKPRDQVAAEYGLSEGAIQQAIERERGRREPAVDPQTLSMSAQEKLEAVMRQEKRKLQAEFERAVQDELKRALNDMVLPQYNKKLAEYQQVIKARKGIMSRATYRMILSWLHPDRVSDSAQKEGITKAFHAFTNLELVLCNEKEMPTNPASIPRNAEEWAKRRAEMKTKRKNQSNSVQHS